MALTELRDCDESGVSNVRKNPLTTWIGSHNSSFCLKILMTSKVSEKRPGLNCWILLKAAHFSITDPPYVSD